MPTRFLNLGQMPAHRVHNLLPWAVLLLLLAGTAVATFMLSGAEESVARARFERAVEERIGRIVAHVDTYVALLLGGCGLFVAEPGEAGDVSRVEFNRFIAELDLEERYPGLLGIGWSQRVTAETIPAVEAAARADGLDTFHVWPTTTNELRTTILYLQPSNRRNKAAYGFDMASEPVRAAAMRRAMDTGTPVLSGKVTLVQEIDAKKQAGFLIYAPVYSTERLPSTVEERRAHLRGFVYAAIRAGDMLATTAASHEQNHEIGDFHVYDGTVPNPETLLHDAVPHVHEDTLTVVRVLPLVNHVWTLRFVATPGLAAPSLAARGFAGAGILVSFVVFAFALAQSRARRALFVGKQRAEQDTELRERLLAIVGHDLRNPLGAISMSAQSMLRRDELDDRTRVSAKRIMDSATRMARMISQLMDYARARQGQELTLSFGPCDVAAAVEHAIDEIRVTRPDVNIRLEIRGRETCICDADRVAEVASNLVGNATQYGDGSVDVLLEQRPDGTVLEVHNEGRAIPAAVLPRIFDPFHRAHHGSSVASMGSKNLGLGLYIARQIVIGHGGRIDVRSTDAEGTTFSVWLPREPR